MDDLVVWLRAQLDEDERIARAACWDEQSDVWTARPPQASYERYTVVDYCDDGVVAVTPENADAEGVGPHIAEHDPARVLREVDAKRELLKIHRPYVPEADQACLGCAGGIMFSSCPVICLLALPYADRPGFREEWRP
ncbi:MAG TPA: DUF6221 family protein [Streptomyces sp.]